MNGVDELKIEEHVHPDPAVFDHSEHANPDIVAAGTEVRDIDAA